MDSVDTTTPDLLPCPFCGEAAIRITLNEADGPDNAGGDVICCVRCNASSNVEFGRKENLVSNWNRRATPDLRDVVRELVAGGAAQTDIIHRAQRILTEYLIPDGIDADSAIDQLLGLLDGPDQRAAQSSWDAAIAKAEGVL